MKIVNDGDVIWIKAEVHFSNCDSVDLVTSSDSEYEVMCASSPEELSKFIDEDVRNGHAVYHSKALDNALKKAEKDAVKNAIKVKQKEIAELEKKLKEL